MTTDTLTATLETLTTSGLIYASRVDDDKVVVSVETSYQGPDCDYDADTAARVEAIDSALAAVGLRLRDSGAEDDRQAEYLIYRAA